MSPTKYEILTGMEVVIAIIVLLIAGAFIAILITYLNNRKKRFMQEKQMMQAEFQNELLKAHLEIQEETLRNVSLEIHDNIGQVLSLVKLNINTMNPGDPLSLQNKINDSRTLITKVIRDLRDLSRSLNTDHVIDLGLTRATESELEMIKRTGDFEIEFDVKGKPYRMGNQQELILFRIVQEALNNIMKHAKARLISVKFLFEPETFTLQIADNGSGFDMIEKGENNYNDLGLGIKNMCNRATAIHADFKLTSDPGSGTTIRVTLPVPKQNILL